MANKKSEQEHETNELQFLAELLKGYTFWKKKGEEEYAKAYLVLLNEFTNIKQDE